MKKPASIILFFLLLTSVTILHSSVVFGEFFSNEKEFVIKSSVRFTAFGHAWNLTEDDKTISLYMNNSWQTVTLLNSSHPFENVTTDEDGNVLAILNLPKIDAGASTEYSVSYQVVSKPRNLPNIAESDALTLVNITDDLKAKYTGNSGTWMTNSTELRHLAETLAGNETNVLVIVENFVQWIWANIDYTSHEVPLYPNETLSSKQGDCDEQAILLISLCRIIGIPAYLQIGCIYTPGAYDDSTAWDGHVENIQNKIGWHGWAMVYIPPWDWLPVDLTYIYASRDNPLNAIDAAAVTSQNVIQYINIVQSDYATDARKYRSFLQNNNFYIRTSDEIIPGRGTDPYSFLVDSLMKYAFVALLLAGVAVVSVVALLIVRQRRKAGKESIGVSSPQ